MTTRTKTQEEPAEPLRAVPANPGPTAWTLTVAPGPAKDFAKNAEAGVITVTAPSPEGTEQIETAIKAAATLVKVIQPDGEKHVAATLSGYANPGATVGQSGTVDQVTIKIRQA